MAARESFEQSQLASQIGIGYGEAQVLPDRAALIEQTRANKAREAAAAAKAKAKADKKKEEDFEIEFPNDLAPAIQAGIQKEALDGYEYLLPYHGTPEYEKKKKEWSIGFGAKVAAAKIESANFKENLKKYGKNRESMNYNPDTDDDISKVMDYNTEATWDEIMGDANKANEDLTTSYKTRGESYLDGKIMSQVEYQTETGSVDIIDPISGAKRTIKTEDFTLDQAKDIIRKNYQTDENVNDLYRTALSKMTDDDKKQYGEDLNGVGDYIADKMAPPYVKKISQVSKTAGWKPDKEGSKKKKLILPKMESGLSPTMHLTEAMKADERGAVKGDVAVVNQIGFSEQTGEDERFAITTGKYFDAETGDWVTETNKHMFTPTTIQDFQTWNGDESVEVTVGGEKIKYKKGDYIPVEAANSLTQDQMANLGWTTTLEGVVKREVGEDEDGPIFENKIIRIPKTEENVSSYSSLRSNRAMYDLYLEERGLDQYAPTSGGTTGGGTTTFDPNAY